MQILTEYNSFEPELELLKEEKDSKGRPKLIMKGILQRAGTLNQNGRIYPRDILERELENYQKLIRERRATGALDHTDSSIIELQTVSHVIREAYFEEDVVYGRVEILPTPHGDTLRNLIESNITVGISSRGLGTVKPDGSGHNVVQEDFQLICWDFVSEPSTPGAFMMKEGREIQMITEAGLRKNFFTQSDRIDRVCNEILHWQNKIKGEK